MTTSKITIVLECDISRYQEVVKAIETFLYKQPLKTWKIDIDPFHSERPLMGDKDGFIDKFNEATWKRRRENNNE
jgi:hypothetical protein